MSDFKFNKCDDYTIILTNRSYVPYGHITNYKVDDINIKNNMNSANEFSFTVYKYMTLEDGTEYEEPLWDKITDLKLIYVKETNEYYEITVQGTDSLATYKTVTGKSLCEAELSQYNLYGIEINTEDDIARDEYVQPTLFYRSLDGLEVDSDAYNVAKDSSLLHRILYGSGKANNYKIKHVDESIANLQRTFSIDGKSIYDFFTGDCAEQFNCLFLFDSTDRSISVYDLYSVCMNDDCSYRLSDKDNPRHLRYRGDFKDVCPKCGSKHIKVYGKDTMVIVDKENLTDEISFSTNSDELKNCFHLKAGDDDMTAAIININPNGTAYLYYVPEYQREDMSKELVDKLVTYDELYDSYTNEYEQLMLNLYNAIDWQLYYMDEMMPGAIPPDERESSGSTEIVTKPVETAEQQIPKLSVNNLNYTALSSITSSTSLSTVESAIKNYAKVFVNTSKFKIETIEDSLGSVYQSGGNNCVKWTGKFKVTNFSDKDDTATSSSITLTIYDNYEEFVNQKIKKSIATDDSTGSIYDVLKIDSLDKYKDTIKLYGIVRLQSFIESIKNVEDILIQQGNQAQDLYYSKYHQMEVATENELNSRQVQYDYWVDKETEYTTRKAEIQDILNFEKYLGNELYGEFCSYRRDQDYSNDNFVSDGLNNTDLFANAREYIRVAKEELVKAATLQCNISCKVKNLFALSEFEPFWDNFQIGNWITIGYDDEFYRLRLISVQGSLNDFSNLDVEFSSITKINNTANDIKDVLNQAQSMASSFNYISRQSTNGQKANDTLSEFQKKSMNAALYSLMNNDQEEISFDNHGITAKAWNDILEDFDPEKLIITHNVLGFTDDNFASLKTALGKVLMPDGTYKYGLNAEVVIGTFLLGKYLELENENGSLKFNGDGFVITNGINTFTVNPNNKEKLLSLSSNNVDVFYVDSNGKLHIQGDGAGLDIASNKTITDMSTSISQTAESIATEVRRATDAEGELQSNITQTADAITAEVTRAQGAEDSLGSMISQTADAIQTEVINRQNADNEMSTQISQTAHSVSISASGSGNTAGITIALYDENGNLIDTEKTANITITGFVSFWDLANAGSTTINGANITTGTINCDLLNGGAIKGQDIVGGRIASENIYCIDSLYMSNRMSWTGEDASLVGAEKVMYIPENDSWVDFSQVVAFEMGATFYSTPTVDGIPIATIYSTVSKAKSATSADNAKTASYVANTATSSHTANMYSDSNNKMYYCPKGSSRRFKTDIEPVKDDKLDPHRLYDVNVVQFKYKPSFYGLPDDTPMDTVIGFIAEDINKKYPCATEYDEETGEVNNWLERYIIPPMLSLIQEQHGEIEQLKSDNFALKGEVDILKQRLEKMEEMLNVINSKIN